MRQRQQCSDTDASVQKQNIYVIQIHTHVFWNRILRCWNWTHVYLIEHIYAKIEHMCDKTEHMHSISEHMCSIFKHMCSIFEHMCSIFEHMRSIFEHMCSIFEHMCSKTEHTCAKLERVYAVGERTCSVWSMHRGLMFVTASFSCSKADDGYFRQLFNVCDVWTYPCGSKWWTQPQSSWKR